ncbi:oxygen-independent coproporphyrinogen-3 oxidase [Octadecabacter temperatus]|uniref:Coproporphyrinogen-III oxidase n=1 Tax=Octadecabacter temperatus TaxID=1458307 RepID=A0A0K0Y201_9RHOB|nr:oxygen-independent coproporphyrinogen III oxidase [Octadecabacter temperatus]AKS44958.1 Oxygen-independent coproporphyrinogen-III oxidase [Octadecabacter temperatus]SIN83412.1 oxygen-independent coproporphyrinogen-3 oxidase [Octadecabacter temperatus]
MKNIDQLRAHGLFDAKVPRYTSYPPANHFENGVGHDKQVDWLSAVSGEEGISVYIHIPFCKRLCWFCACRTQGTKTLRPVDAYVEFLRSEIRAVRAALPKGVSMARLHLGGGTPTILSVKTMSLLLSEVFSAFTKTDDFEFSVEVDPTEASDQLLETLVNFGLNRVSLGVQDFAPVVQDAIGRSQSLEQTHHVIDFLRARGVAAFNLDLLYGLPHQTMESFKETLDHVIAMKPDRLAIYGYAHVPWMSKRQVLIKSDDLPDNEVRFELAMLAQKTLVNQGYDAIGIDHFALPTDKLAIAQNEGCVRRNFQGYTDDQCETLIGFGASAISKFKQGFLQNAVATSAYQDRINQNQMAAHKGYKLTVCDGVISKVVEDLLCRFALDNSALNAEFPEQATFIRAISVMLMQRYSDAFHISKNGLQMNGWAKPLVRIIANSVDTFSSTEVAHSSAI